MGISFRLKSTELLLNFLRHDVDKIPLYGFSLQKQRFSPAVGAVPLPRCSPEKAGVPCAAIEEFYRAVAAMADSVACHAMLVMRHGKVIAEGAFAPYRLDVPHMLYSMSKSITGLAVGMAADEGLLSIDERLLDIFPEYATGNNTKALKNLTLKHLLTMSSGIRFNEVGSALDENWLRMFMDSALKFEPGTAFDYNSMNSYALAAAVCKCCGTNLSDYLAPRLFEPLGIALREWERCPKGIEKGGWGLNLTVEDAAKIGLLCLNKGIWNGKRLVSESWINAATSPQITTPNGEMKHGYGYQIWMSDDEGSYQFNGAFGQYVLVFPKYDAVIAIFGGSPNLFAHGEITEAVNKMLPRFMPNPLSEDEQAQASLKNCLSSLEYTPTLPEELGTDEDEFERIGFRLDGREYTAGANTAGLFPQTLQAVHGNMTKSVSLFRFEKRGKDLCLFVYEQGERNMLLLRHDGALCLGAVTMRTERQLTGTRCRWKLCAGHIKLCVTTSFIETPNTRLMHMDIYPNKLVATFDELPSLNKTLQMLFDLVGISGMAFYKRILPLLKSEGLVKQLRTIGQPVVECGIIRHNDEEPLPNLDRPHPLEHLQ